jgi:hypothetical protein
MPSEAARLVATAAWKPASASAAGSMAPPGPAGGRKRRLAVITATEGTRDAATELLADAPRLRVAEAEGEPVRVAEAVGEETAFIVAEPLGDAGSVELGEGTVEGDGVGVADAEAAGANEVVVLGVGDSVGGVGVGVCVPVPVSEAVVMAVSVVLGVGDGVGVDVGVCVCDGVGDGVWMALARGTLGDALGVGVGVDVDVGLAPASATVRVAVLWLPDCHTTFTLQKVTEPEPAAGAVHRPEMLDLSLPSL